MTIITSRVHRRFFALALALLTVLALASAVTGPSAQAGTSEGLQCETGPRGNPAFDLTATSGYIYEPDGNTVFMWSFAGSSGVFQFPGPNLCVAQGDTVTVRLHNLLREPVSIVFPGQEGVTADSQPAQPQLDASGVATSLVQPAAANGGIVTYSFVATRPGTFLYESGTDVAKQVQMGLYGALIVRPSSDGTVTGSVLTHQAYADASTAFKPGQEYVHLLSEIDPALHQAVETRRSYDVTQYKARYFLVNGRSMPDTLAPNNAAWLPSQPYGATVHIQPYDATNNSQPALIRYLSVGPETYPFHPHGNDQKVIARDGFPLVSDNGQPDRSYDKYLIDVGPGQTVDSTLVWTDAEAWDPNTNPIPVDLPPNQDIILTPDTWFSDNPYLGHQSDLPVGVTNNNQCGEYYHVAHSHALQQATNYGATFGGMMTLIRIDPPNGCTTAP